jgi:type II secretory pathway component GspD/PulD (secretin)
MKHKLIYALLIPVTMFSLYICDNIYAQAAPPATPLVAENAPPAAPPATMNAPPTTAPGQEAEISAVAPSINTTTDTPDNSAEMTFIKPADIDEQITSSTNDLISITLNDVPLIDVVRMFTLVSGANIVANSDTLTGTVTVNLKDVEWKPALNSILDMHGFSLVEKELNSGVYSIVQRPLDAPIPMLTKSFKLKFATVADISPIIRNMLPESATLNEFNSRNMLVVRSTSESLSDIDQIIKEIDQPTKQVCVETKFMELKDSASKELGIRWDALQEFGMNLKAGPFTYDRTAQNALSRTDTQNQYDRNTLIDSSKKLYDMYGVQHPEIDPADDTRVLATRTIEDNIERGKENTQEIIKSFNENIENTQAAILELDQFQVVLSALYNTEGVSLISNPKLIVANGATNAMFSVGDREPIIRTEIQRGTTESPGDIITASLDTEINTGYIKQGYLETGIDLRVIPVVKTDNLIEAELIPSLRRKTGDKTIGDNSWPIISVKEIRTRFTLLSGQTVAIGGLTDTGDTKEISKVPLLGDIPLIGKYLFSHSKKVKSQVETIIFVTLSIANPEEIHNNIGIPEYGDLVHKRLITDKILHQERQTEIQNLQNMADREQQEKAREMRKELLRRK